MSKQHVAILCGGQSVEHEISLLSAGNVFRDVPDAFTKSVLYIARDGQWYYLKNTETFYEQSREMRIDKSQLQKLLIQPGSSQPFIIKETGEAIAIDCIFPVLHGPNGEDGTVQGLFELLNIAYVGCHVVSSAVCMEKHLAKDIVRQHGIPTLDWVTIDTHHQTTYSYSELKTQLSEVLFVKPTRLGSALGVSKVHSADEYHVALQSAFEIDHRVIVEPAVKAREIEVSVIGNEKPIASLPGEVVVNDDFYTYEAKYFDAEKSFTVSPVDLPQPLIERCQQLALDVYKALLCRGMARVDFFLIDNDKLVLNEVNPIPGFTDISMYPKNWAASGLTYSALISRLIELAFEAHAHKQRLQLMPTSKKDVSSRL